MKTPTREGKCPECEKWSAIEWDPALPPGGWWWKDNAGCPACGYMALVESECEMRDVPEKERAAGSGIHGGSRPGGLAGGEHITEPGESLPETGPG